ncbi:MAG: MFS transporter [Akkermansiaceae bacterium]
MNLLKTKPGRLAAFGGLYFSEGLPQGFVATALALEFKRQGMNVEAITTFAAIAMLPWAWKFVIGPLVDNLHIRRFGARKQWIVMAQTGMLVWLALALLNMPTVENGKAIGIGLFTFLMVMHNVFAATQDVAIDALACNVLKKDERGLANGLMFGGAHSGHIIGGSGVIMLKEFSGSFSIASLLVPFLLLAVLVFTITLICEKSAAREMEEGEIPAPDPGDAGFIAAVHQIGHYAVAVGRTFFLTRRGFLGLVVALLPLGGMALSQTVSTLIAPTLGMDDKGIASLALFTGIVWVISCMCGGFISDRIGRRISLAIFAGLSVVPGLWMAWKFHQLGWNHPPEGVNGVWPHEPQLITYWWTAAMAFSVFNGLMYGVRSAFFMDIVNPKIAGTHFTACMAMINLVAAYTNIWQGKALDTDVWNWTLPKILVVDSILGLVFLAVLPFVKPKQIHLDD